MTRKSKCKEGHFQKISSITNKQLSTRHTQVRLVHPAGFRDVLELKTDLGIAVTP